MTSITMVSQNIEARSRNFVVANFKAQETDRDAVRKRIKNMAESIIHGTADAHGDIVAAVRGMLAGVRICAKDSHLNVQSALCEAATAAYYTALEQSKELAGQIKRIAEGIDNDQPITLYKIYRRVKP